MFAPSLRSLLLRGERKHTIHRGEVKSTENTVSPSAQRSICAPITASPSACAPTRVALGSSNSRDLRAMSVRLSGSMCGAVTNSACESAQSGRGSATGAHVARVRWLVVCAFANRTRPHSAALGRTRPHSAAREPRAPRLWHRACKVIGQDPLTSFRKGRLSCSRSRGFCARSISANSA